MASTTTTPQQILEDRKVQGMLDALSETSATAVEVSSDLQRNPVIRKATSVKSQLSSTCNTLDKALDTTEAERGEGLNGKLKDLRKFKTYVQAQLAALEEADMINGQVEIVVTAGIDVVIADVLGAYALIAGSGAELKRLQIELAVIKKKLEAASRIARDTKVKAAIGAALTGATMALGPVSAPVGVLVFVGGIALDKVIDSALQGREDTSLKSAWGYADQVAGAADAFDKLPDHMGPVMDLVNIGIDISECFAAESDKAALMAQITAFNKTVTAARAKFRADATKIKKIRDEARSELAGAIAEVGRYSPPRYSFAAVTRLL